MVIRTLKKKDYEAIWFDAKILPKSFLQQMLSYYRFTDIPNQDTRSSLSSYKESLKNKENDEIIHSLFSFYLKEYISDIDVDLKLKGFYIIPPCQKPNFSKLKDTYLKNNYNYTKLDQLKFGPPILPHTHRSVTYRQFLFLYNSKYISESRDLLQRCIEDTNLNLLIRKEDYPGLRGVFEREIYELLRWAIKYNSDNKNEITLLKRLKKLEFIVNPFSLNE